MARVVQTHLSQELFNLGHIQFLNDFAKSAEIKFSLCEDIYKISRLLLQLNQQEIHNIYKLIKITLKLNSKDDSHDNLYQHIGRKRCNKIGESKKRNRKNESSQNSAIIGHSNGSNATGSANPDKIETCDYTIPNYSVSKYSYAILTYKTFKTPNSAQASINLTFLTIILEDSKITNLPMAQITESCEEKLSQERSQNKFRFDKEAIHAISNTNKDDNHSVSTKNRTSSESNSKRAFFTNMADYKGPYKNSNDPHSPTSPIYFQPQEHSAYIDDPFLHYPMLHSPNIKDTLKSSAKFFYLNSPSSPNLGSWD